MNITMQQVSAVMGYFIAQQKKYNYNETGNIIQQKWDMRDIAQSIPTGKELKQLIKFFMHYSDDRSFKSFTYHYDEYYASMNNIKADLASRAFLQEETLARARLNEVKGETPVE